MSDSASQDSSLDTTDSPSIDMETMDNNNTNLNKLSMSTTTTMTNIHIKQQSIEPDINNMNNNNNNNDITNSSTSSFINYDELKPEHITQADDFLFNSSDFNMLDFSQQTSNPHSLTMQYGINGINGINGIPPSPILGFQSGTLNLTPSMNALHSGLHSAIPDISISNPNAPNLPDLDINANSQINDNNNNNNDENSDNNNNEGEEEEDDDLSQTNNNNNNNNQNNGNWMGMGGASLPPSMPHHGIPSMPHTMLGVGDNIPPPSDDLGWNNFCRLIEQGHINNPDLLNANIQNEMPALQEQHNPYSVAPNGYENGGGGGVGGDRFDEFNDNQPQHHQQTDFFDNNNSIKATSPQISTNTATTLDTTNEFQDDNDNDNDINNNKRKRKKRENIVEEIIDENDEIQLSTPTKKRRLNNKKSKPKKEEKIEIEVPTAPKKRKRGRPRKNPEKVEIKKEKNGKKSGRGRKKKNSGSDDEINMDEYYASQADAVSYVGIRTKDGEVCVQIPPPKRNDGYPKVEFTVFGNACSDKIEDILQPKKRTRYVRGLSEEEKKTRRYEDVHITNNRKYFVSVLLFISPFYFCHIFDTL